MAKLVKLRVQPHKYILKRSLQLVKLNCVVPLAQTTKNQVLLDTLQENSAKAREAIRQFSEGIVRANNKSRERGIERAERQLMIETLFTCAHFFARIESESVAMENLARKIAANITHRPDRFLPFLETKPPQNMLQSAVELSLEVPAHEFQFIVPHLENMKQGLGTEVVLNPVRGDRACLQVNMSGFLVSLKFNPQAFSRIAKGLTLRLLNCNCDDHTKKYHSDVA